MAQVTAQTGYSKRLSKISKLWQDNRWLYVIAGVLLGILVTPAIEQITGNLNELIGNLVPEAVGIVFTVLILNRLAENRAKEELKKRLIREAGSQSNETAKAAIDWMRAEGWLTIYDDIQLLKGASLSQANLQGANLRGANLEASDLEDAKLENSDLMNANLDSAVLFHANLEGADLFRTNLQHANLKYANLQGADLKYANLQNADLDNANLADAILENASLQRASFENAKFNEKTVLPNRRYMSPKETWTDHLGNKYWLPNTKRLLHFTDPNHPDFWQPDWVKEQED